MSRLEKLLNGAGSVAISGHIRPDGDCVGSVMSIYQYIRKNIYQASTWGSHLAGDQEL